MPKFRRSFGAGPVSTQRTLTRASEHDKLKAVLGSARRTMNRVIAFSHDEGCLEC
jgi:hypothetical protein